MDCGSSTLTSNHPSSIWGTSILIHLLRPAVDQTPTRANRGVHFYCCQPASTPRDRSRLKSPISWHPMTRSKYGARQKQGGFSVSTEQYDLTHGPWPISHCADAPGPVLTGFDPSDQEMAILLNEGQWIHKPDHRDLMPDTVGLLPFIVHKSHCNPATAKDSTLWRRQQEENQASPKGFTGYFLDPDLFQLIARGSRLQLPNIPFHAAHWRQPACLRFRLLLLASVMRVGQLQSLAAWRSLLNPSPSRLPLCWGLTNLGLPMPHDLPTNDFIQSTRALLWLLLEQSSPMSPDQQQGGPANAVSPLSETPEAQTLAALTDRTLESHEHVKAALLKHSLQCTRDYHLLVMVIGLLLSLPTQKSELLVRGVYGAGKTMCIALLASVSRENTTIKAMADFVHQLLPRGPDDAKPSALRLWSGSQARSSTGTQLDARDRDDNHTIFNARLILATTGLHLAQFRHRFRPLEKAVDYAELLIYDEAQQEASVSNVTILGALPHKCLVLRLGDPKQTSGGTAASPLARQVMEVSDQLPLGIRAPRTPWLPLTRRKPPARRAEESKTGTYSSGRHQS